MENRLAQISNGRNSNKERFLYSLIQRSAKKCKNYLSKEFKLKNKNNGK